MLGGTRWPGLLRRAGRNSGSSQEAGFSALNDLPWQFLRKGQTPGHGQRGITRIPENTEPWPQQKSE